MDAEEIPGNYEINFRRGDLKPGIYFLIVSINNENTIRKLILN